MVTFGVRPTLDAGAPLLRISVDGDAYDLTLDEAAAVVSALRVGIQRAMRLAELVADPSSRGLLLAYAEGSA